MTCLLTNKIYTGSTESNTHRHSKHNKAIYIGYNIIVIERRMSWRYNIGTWGEREREREELTEGRGLVEGQEWRPRNEGG